MQKVINNSGGVLEQMPPVSLPGKSHTAVSRKSLKNEQAKRCGSSSPISEQGLDLNMGVCELIKIAVVNARADVCMNQVKLMCGGSTMIYCTSLP